MGLDMYLEAEHYVSASPSSPDKALYTAVVEAAGLSSVATPHAPSAVITVKVGYWRKANAVHAWFVNNVQDGVDECQRSYVDPDNLRQLVKDCTDAVQIYKAGDIETAAKIMPPQEGFFFGNSDASEWWAQYLQETIDMLRPILEFSDTKNGSYDFYYRASW